jgi:hypothetical protein
LRQSIFVEMPFSLSTKSANLRMIFLFEVIRTYLMREGITMAKAAATKTKAPAKAKAPARKPIATKAKAPAKAPAKRARKAA